MSKANEKRILMLIPLSIVVFLVFFTLNQAWFSDANTAETTSVVSSESEPKTSFTFTAAGDFSFSNEASLVLRGLEASGSAFTLALGDLGYGGNGTEQAWCEFVNSNIGDNHPFEIVAGNHDNGEKDGDIIEYRKCLPNKVDDLHGNYGLEYYFDYNNLARFILVSPDINNYGYSYVKDSEHYAWLSSTIDDARSNNIEWVILGMHKNCITSGVKSCEISEDIINLAIKKEVSLILQGHEHSYFRSKPLRIGDKCPAIIANEYNAECTAEQGTTLAIIGTGGVQLRDVNLADSEIGYFETWNGANTGNSHGYGHFTVTPDSIQAKFVPVGNDRYTDNFIIPSNR